MTCYHPLTAYYSREIGSSGKRGVTFDRSASFSGIPLKLPCGQCIGCRLDRSLQWAVRCMHEKQLHDASCFLTVTYEDKYLPEGNTLVMEDHQKFMKRLRKRKGGFGKGTRFFMCGEYGEKNARPHYHYLFFNRDFKDRKFYKMAKNGRDRLYTSEFAEDVWEKGLCVIGEVTLESCAYVARYICDKVNGDEAQRHYEVVTSDGVVVDRFPEFTCMSRNPGIASDWYEKFGKHSHLSGDFAVLDGKRVRMPRFYDGRFELTDPEELAKIKKRRLANARRYRKNNTRDRLRVREVVALKRLKMYERSVK